MVVGSILLSSWPHTPSVGQVGSTVLGMLLLICIEGWRNFSDGLSVKFIVALCFED